MCSFNILFFIKNLKVVTGSTRKEWKTPLLEQLNVNKTMKGWDHIGSICPKCGKDHKHDNKCDHDGDPGMDS
ncbi:paeninodin family lasso peptide [Halobacillus andaensis]|uniref:paeninodin family lasso peptide n=1 Tax=Halobacillus andaensis TaxID=1176239 RepID=UPI003D714637